MAKVEFESLFSQIHIDEIEISINKSLETAVGAYLACCYATNSCPFHPAILAPKVKHAVVEKAIGFAQELESDPVNDLIAFVRRCT